MADRRQPPGEGHPPPETFPDPPLTGANVGGEAPARAADVGQPTHFGPLYQYLAEDHELLGAWLDQTISHPGAIDEEAYARFRAGLLRHIGMEEKILLPAARRLHDGVPLPVAAGLRRDHAALTALLVPPPTAELVRTIQTILEEHNPLEEGPGGLYETCEELAKDELEPLVAQLRAAPEVPVRPHVDSPQIRHNIEVLLQARTATGSDPEAGERLS